MSAHPARVAGALLVAQSPFDGTGVSARASRSRCADAELLGERGGASSSSSSSSRVIAPRVGLSFCDDVGFGAIFRVGKDGPAGGTRRGGSTAARCAIALPNGSGRSADAARRTRSCRCMRSRGACVYVDLRGGRLQARRAAWDWREEGREKAIVEDRWCRDSRWDRRSVALRNHGAESVGVSLGEAVEERTWGEEKNPSGEAAGEAVENDKSPSSGSRNRAGDPVLIVPGFLADAYEFVPLAEYLRSLGFNALVAPIRWYHWVPTLGGRSIRPILDRMDATITYALKLKQGGESLRASGTRKLSHGEGENLSGNDGEDIAGGQGPSRNGLVANAALPGYTFADFILELRDPREGSQVLRRQSLASTPTNVSKSSESGNGNWNGGTWLNDGNLQEQGDDRRVVVVAHSAAGWIARILMGSRAPYDGKIYGLAPRIKVLLTLGTPHFCTDKLTKRNLDFVNVNYPGTMEESEGVEYICVAGKAKVGVAKFGGLLQDVAYQSYMLCCGRGDVWGDGITPVECALGVPGAEHLLVDGVQHSPAAAKKGGKWYGSPGVVEQWVSYIDAFREKSEGGHGISHKQGLSDTASRQV